MYSHLRFVIAAALIAFGSVIAVGVPALLLAVDRPLLAQNDVSEPPAASSCGQQGWLHFDRNCSQRGLPWAAARGTANAGPVEAPLEPAADQPLTEGRQAATAPEPSAPQFSMRQLSEPQLFAPQISVPQSFTSRDTAARELPPQESATNDAAPRTAAAKDTAPQVTAPQVTQGAPSSGATSSGTPSSGATSNRPTSEGTSGGRARGSRAPRIGDPRIRTPRGRTRAAGGAERGDSTGADEVGTASAGRGSARRAIPGRCADPCTAREASRSRGANRETTDERSLECGAEIRGSQAGNSCELLCRRRHTAQDRHPAHLDPGRLLLLCTAIARVRPSRWVGGVSSSAPKR